MIDYSKLATLLVRLGAVYAAAIGLMTLAFFTTALLQGGASAIGPQPGERLLVSVYYFAGAAALFLLSRQMGRALAKGL